MTKLFADFLCEQQNMKKTDLYKALGWSRQRYCEFRKTKTPSVKTLGVIQKKLKLSDLDIAKLIGKYHLQLK